MTNRRDPTIDIGTYDRAPVEWLWEKRIPRGMITLVGGLPGVGKSLFAYFLAGEISRRGSGVIYVTCEESTRHALRPRMDAAEAQLEREQVRHWQHATFPRDTAALAAAVLAYNVELIVVDPLTNHLEASIYQMKRVREAIRPLEELADSTNAAIMLSLHTIKNVPRGAHPIRAFPGAQGGIAGLARAAYIFGAMPGEDERVLAAVKSSYSELPASFRFSIEEKWLDIGDTACLEAIGEDGDSLEDARVMLSTVRKDEESSESIRAAAAKWLVLYLRLGPRPVGEIQEDAKLAGHSYRTIRRAADDIGIKKPAGGPGSEWKLPEGFPVEPTDD